MTLLLIIIYIVFISLGLPDSLYGAAWPVMHKSLNLPESTAAVFSVIVAMSTASMGFFSGKIIRKHGTAKTTAYSIVLTIIGILGISFANNALGLIPFSIILGLGAGAIDTTLNNFVSLHYKSNHMNWLHAFWGLGITTGPIILSIFLKDGNWRSGYRVVAIIQSLICLLVFLSLDKWKIVNEKTTNNPTKKQSKNIDVFGTPGLLPSILSLGMYCALEAIPITWGASYLVHINKLTPDVAARWSSLFLAGIMAGRVVAGFVSEKLKDVKMIKLGSLIQLFGILVIMIFGGNATTIGLFMLGFGCGPIFPSVLHYIPDRFGTELSADITGYHMGSAYFIAFSTQLLFGFIATKTSFIIMPYVLAVLCVMFIFLNIKVNKITLK
ncbi:MAG: MFS transporter [Christensenellaceae bacterium]|nr:MFS transporter [Christensenellaceae bacterium]